MCTVWRGIFEKGRQGDADGRDVDFHGQRAAKEHGQCCSVLCCAVLWGEVGSRPSRGSE
jgi:hypothetical protein